ncbi:MAG: penicillin-binding protein activator [Bdellovibrionaceae bacterium]|nr:penicillin-binding protein activator [Pseudobdellovibrionaceae bacterium]
MKKTAFFYLIFVFGLGCTSNNIKTQRPELADKPVTTPKKAIPKNPPTALPGQTPAAPTDPTAANAVLLEENKFSQMERAGSYWEAFNISATLSTSHTDSKKADFYKSKSIDFIYSRLSKDNLHTIARTSDYGYLRGYALFKLAEMELASNNIEESKRYYRSVVELLPESDIAVSSQKVLSDMEATVRVSSQTIGVVLPLTGKSSAVGQKVLRGLQLGLGTHQGFSKFRLAIVDSEGRSDLARLGVEKLVKEDNVIAIVGGVLSKTVGTELAIASEYNIPFIYLSQKQGLNDIHPTAIRNSLTAEMQVRHLVRTAMTEMDMSEFAILYPNDPYGVEYANIFWDEVLTQGGQIVAAQTYDPKETDFRPVVQRLVGTYFIEARKDEYYQKLRAFKQTLKGKNARENVNTDDLLTPIQNFDAIFIPDQARVISQINAFLNYSRVKDTKILSTNILNTPGSAKRLAQLNFPIYFADNFISEGPNQSVSDFVREYMSYFNEYPAQFEVSAYDSGLILRQLVLQGVSSREEMGRQLLKLRKFDGSFGPLSTTSGKDLFRPLMTLTVQKGETVKVK